MNIFIDSQRLNQPGENIKVDLQHVIDNTCDKYCVTPIEISYYAGYFNINETNSAYRYSNGVSTFNATIAEGLYSVDTYFQAIKSAILIPDNINYSLNVNNGTVTISVVAPYTFSIIQANRELLGFDSLQTITSSATSDNPINFLPNKMLYFHLKQIKNKNNYFNGNNSDILARLPLTSANFGTLVQYRFDRPYSIVLDNSTITSLELTITDENNNIIDL
jgi:hypothetical protein